MTVLKTLVLVALVLGGCAKPPVGNQCLKFALQAVCFEPNRVEALIDTQGLRQFVNHRVAPRQKQGQVALISTVTHPLQDEIEIEWSETVAKVLAISENRNEWYRAFQEWEFTGFGPMKFDIKPAITVYGFPANPTVDFDALALSRYLTLAYQAQDNAGLWKRKVTPEQQGVIEANEMIQKARRSPTSQISTNLGMMVLQAEVIRQLQRVYRTRRKDIVFFDETNTPGLSSPFVDLAGNLYLPIHYIDTLNPRERSLVLLHEAMHLLMIDTTLMSNIVGARSRTQGFFEQNELTQDLSLMFFSSMGLEPLVDAAVLRYLKVDRIERLRYIQLIEQLDKTPGRVSILRVLNEGIESGIWPDKDMVISAESIANSYPEFLKFWGAVRSSDAVGSSDFESITFAAIAKMPDAQRVFFGQMFEAMFIYMKGNAQYLLKRQYDLARRLLREDIADFLEPSLLPSERHMEEERFRNLFGL